MRTLLIGLCFFLYAVGTNAHEMKMTMYHDGVSCPGGCDAHVVLNARDNGTLHAYLPSSSRSNPAACVSGADCRICFDDTDKNCMNVTYRGSGPPSGKFDFTPAFYEKYCGRTDIPSQLTAECRRLDTQVTRSGYSTRVNCFVAPDDPLCSTVIANATSEQQADARQREVCLEMGQARYNATQSNPAKRRSLGCNYTKLSLGRNSKGVTWRRLMPGACKSGSFVGRDGLDCCSNDLRLAATIHPECTPYFPRR
jgi:hypothetical protein